MQTFCIYDGVYDDFTHRIYQNTDELISVLLSVSGGVDPSCCWTYSLLKCPKTQKHANWRFSLNHPIRAEACADYDLVKSICTKNALQFHGYEIDMPKLANMCKMSVESVSRNVRYNLAWNLANVHGYEYVIS